MYRPEYLSRYYDEYDVSANLEGTSWTGYIRSMKRQPLPMYFDPVPETTTIQTIDVIELMPWTIHNPRTKGYEYDYRY